MSGPPAVAIPAFDSRSPVTPRRAAGWAGAFALVLGVHVGLYALATLSDPIEKQDAQDAAAAVMIDLLEAPTPAQSQVDSSVPGPPADAQEEIKEAEELPPLMPPLPDIDLPQLPDMRSEAELAPQVVLPEPPPPEPVTIERQPPDPKPPEPRKPEPKKPEPRKPEPKKPKKPQPARVQTGGPVSEGQQVQAAASTTGGSAAQMQSRVSWMNLVRSYLARAKRYPPEARAQDAEGTALLTLTIGPGGELVGVQLSAGSGFAVLDQEAVATARRAAPYPAPADGRQATVRIGIKFDRR